LENIKLSVSRQKPAQRSLSAPFTLLVRPSNLHTCTQILSADENKL